MDEEGEGGRTEGYLYSFGASKAGGIYCVLTFCVLSGQRFAQLRHKGDLVTLRSGVLDSNHRVEDTGRQLVNGKVLYTLRLYSVCDYSKEVLLGSASAEEASEWLTAFLLALGKPVLSRLEPWPSTESFNMTRQESLKREIKRLKTIGKVTPIMEPATPEAFPVPPKWKLVRCENGLRFFKEMCSGSKVPVMKAVGVVKGPADLIFDEIMNYGPERFQWDHTVETASIVEVLDGHSDIVHVCLTQDWRSVDKKPPEPGHVRAIIHSGGYMITPLKSSKCMVESVFEIDAGGWPPCLTSNYCDHLRGNLLSVISGVRDYFAVHRMNSTHQDMKSGPMGNTTVVAETIPQRMASTPFLESDMEDFFDARADQLSDTESQSDIWDGKHRLAKAYNGHSGGIERYVSFSGTLVRGVGRNAVSEPDSSLFKLRGKNFLRDALLAPAEEPVFKLAAADWYKTKEKLDNVSHLRGIAKTPDTFFFTFNLQVPHSGNCYNLVFYFATKAKILDGSLLHQFIHEDDRFRNQRLLLLPSVPEGSWIVRQAVGSRAVVLGQILECSYHRGKNYIEVDVNMGSSGIVRGVMGIVFGYISALVVDIGFSLRAESESELPEELLGAVRCFRLDLSAAVEPM